MDDGRHEWPGALRDAGLPPAAVALGDRPIGPIDGDEAAGRDGLRSTVAQALDQADHLDGRQDRDQAARQETQEGETQGLLQHGFEYRHRALAVASEQAGNRCSALAMAWFARHPKAPGALEAAAILGSQASQARAQETDGPTVSLTR
jgi:hypothetical protein